MRVACVKEQMNNEYRVGISPADVKQYVKAGHEVIIESGAGVHSGFSDASYAEMGARIEPDAAKVWEQAELMVKVKDPTPAEYKYLREDLILFGYLHLAANTELLDLFLERKVTSFAYETVADEEGHLPLLVPMSQIAGRLSIFTGAHALQASHGGMGILLSGVPGVRPAEVLILGGGQVGSNAATIAHGIGANVTLLDVNLKRLAELDERFGNQINTLFSDEVTIDEQIEKADLVISTVLIPGGRAPKLITKEHVKRMKKGSVIVDVAIDQGGSTELSRPTTHDDPCYVVDDVIFYCISNMPGAVPVTSTKSLTNATIRYGLQIAAEGVHVIEHSPSLCQGLNTYQGKITYKNLADSVDMEYCDPLKLIKQA